MADEDKDDTEDIPKVVEGETETITDTEIEEAVEAVIDAAVSKAVEEKDWGGGRLTYGPMPGEVDDFKAETREKLAWVTERFDKYYKPHPDAFDDLIERIKPVATEFGVTGTDLKDTDRGEFESAQNLVEPWDGAMADSFNKNFLNPIPAIMMNHGRMATLLHSEAVKTKEMYKVRRKNAKDVADKTVEAIESITDSNGGVFAIMFAAIIAAGTFLTLGSGGVAFTGAALISGATLGGPFAPGEKDEVPLGADSIEGVLDNMSNALDDVDSSLDEEQNTLNEAMERTDMAVHPEVFPEGNKQTQLLPLKPELAGADVESIRDRFVQFD